MKTPVLAIVALVAGKPEACRKAAAPAAKPEACRKLAGGVSHRKIAHPKSAPDGAVEDSGTPAGVHSVFNSFRGLRSFLASPPANFRAAFRAVGRLLALRKGFAVILTAAALAACQKPTAENTDPPPENGAQYKKDKGLALTDSMKKAIALKVAEVEESKVAPSFTVALHVIADGGSIQRVAFSPTANAASGWLTAEQAALVKTGMEVELRAEAPGAPRETGVVKRVEKAPYQMLGDFEVTVESTTPLETGARVLATFHAPAGEAVTAIPRSALLKTAEGHFVYAVNAGFYVRTPVKVGALSDDHAEITDGLYTGDQVVVSPVMSLWLAELQVLRGGKACCLEK